MCSGKRANGSDRRPPRRYQPLVVVCVGFCWGILLERWIDGLAELGWQVSVLALLSWFVCYRRRLYRWALFSLLTAVVSLGAFWHGQYWSHYPSTEIGRFLAETHQPVCLEAIARSHAIELPGSAMGVPVHGQANPEYRLEVDVCAVRDGRRWRPVTGRAVLSVTGSIQQVQCGDRLRISAHGQRIPEPQNPGEFSLARYYRAQRTLVRLHGMANGVRVIEPAAGKVFFRFLEQVRQHARHQFNRHLPPREAALAAAIVVGQRGQLDSERREVFLVTGTLHLLVVSGFHVGMLASGIWLLGRLGLFGRRSTLWIVIGLTILYAVLPGDTCCDPGPCSVWRSTLWSTCFFWKHNRFGCTITINSESHLFV